MARCAGGSSGKVPVLTIAPGVEMPVVGLGAAHFRKETVAVRCC